MATKNVVLKDSNSNELNPQTTITQIKDSSGNALFSVSGTGISTANSYTINGASITDSSITSGKVNWRNSFLHLQDGNGHPMYRKNSFYTAALTGVTYDYSAAVLNGSLLTIVIAGHVDAGTTIPQYGFWGVVFNSNDPIDQWILSKIYPIESGNNPTVLTATMEFIERNNYTVAGSLRLFWHKYQDLTQLRFINYQGGVTIDSDSYFRMEITLVIQPDGEEQ